MTIRQANSCVVEQLFQIDDFLEEFTDVQVIAVLRKLLDGECCPRLQGFLCSLTIRCAEKSEGYKFGVARVDLIWTET